MSEYGVVQDEQMGVSRECECYSGVDASVVEWIVLLDIVGLVHILGVGGDVQLYNITRVDILWHVLDGVVVFE